MKVSLLSVAQSYIKPVNRSLENAIENHLNNLTKPKGSLGYLEEIAKKYCLITGTDRPVLEKKLIVTFAADHGVAEEGVSAYPSEVTAQMVLNMLSGGAAINVLANHAKADVKVVDIGVNYEFEPHEKLIDRKIKKGTGNIAKTKAMERDEAIQAIESGISIAWEAIDSGYNIIGTGDMGIANTTPSSALMAALMNVNVEDVTGYGTGIDDETLKHKIDVIKKALRLHRESLGDPIDALSALGGLEIAGICGLIIGCASRNTPVVVDGFISSAAALVAYRICPTTGEYMFFSHRSQERGHRIFLNMMKEKPILDLDLRLGEGTGAALAIPIIEAAVKIYNEMATFEKAGVSKKRE